MTKPRKPQIDLDLDYIDKLKAIGMSDKSIPDVTFTFADYQCLERLMNIRDITVEDDLRAFLKEIYEADNTTMCENVAEIVSGQNKRMFDTLEAVRTSIEGIAKDIFTIKEDIIDIKKRLGEVECKVSDEDKRITKLEKTQRWWNIAMRIMIAVAISTIITLLVHYNL